MNIHEWQAQELLRQYNINVPKGEVASNIDEALSAYDKLGSDQIVVKAQVHAGGRGTAGGIRIVDSKATLVDVVRNLLGTKLVTDQTDDVGQPIEQVYLVKPCSIKSELYLSAVIDRDSKKICFMVCKEGGVNIEAIASTKPNSIHTFHVDPLEGVLAYQCYLAAKTLRLNEGQTKQFYTLTNNLYAAFVNCDLSLLEINPLVIDDKGDLVCLDTKINIDDNALFRQTKIRQMRDLRQENYYESRAKKWDLSYIALEGNIGCMVNGAGLAMATMDTIKLAGGEPANFLDVGGSVTKDRVSEAFRIIQSDSNVEVILINIFGGIVRCDMIAEGIIQAVADSNTNLKIIVRLEGNNAALGDKKFAASGLNITATKSFWDAAKLAVKAADTTK
ncbi:MAG: ADP-forming succinate--CoA ligase subunit beta [Pseudomonadota bacterium]|nr:ADP-forming succinate--CoA ligase subunit beta [Pseudomonadota bacterium]